MLPVILEVTGRKQPPEQILNRRDLPLWRCKESFNNITRKNLLSQTRRSGKSDCFVDFKLNMLWSSESPELVWKIWQNEVGLYHGCSKYHQGFQPTAPHPQIQNEDPRHRKTRNPSRPRIRYMTAVWLITRSPIRMWLSTPVRIQRKTKSSARIQGIHRWKHWNVNCEELA